jgi:heme ABC exporter ATP-binding subunit CcmA
MPSHEGGSLLEVRGLQRSFGRARILRDIDISLEPGEALAVIGPNGAGKSTLLRLLAGLLRPDRGEVRVLGHPLRRGASDTRKAVGLLPHQSLLYDDLTVLENLVFAARLYGLDRPHETAWSALERGHLAQHGSALPRHLSRGLLQRVALARALLHSPRLILLDEPFTALDAAAGDRLRLELGARLGDGAGMIVVTHHLSDIWELATRVAVLTGGHWAAHEPRSGSLDTFLSRYHAIAE